MTVKAFAKINLYLDVLGKRADGYHEIRTVMQTVNFYDRLSFRELKGEEVKVIYKGRYVPLKEGDSVKQAVELLKKYGSLKRGIRVKVEKNIPVGAGLGGGSADAAATLKALNLLWQLNLPLRELADLSGELGSDVPSFILGGTVYAEGRGERVREMPALPRFWVIIVYPGFPIFTSEVYKEIGVKKLTTSPERIRILDRLGKVSEGGELKECLYNKLEEVVLKKYPVLRQVKKNLISQGALGALLAGSGSAVFGILSNREVGEEIKKFFKKYPYQVGVVQSI